MTRPIRLSDMPLIDKVQVTAAGPRIVVAGVDPADLPTVRSGGTTGEPTTFYRDHDAKRREAARLEAVWRPFGIRPGDRVAVLVGRPVGAAPDRSVYRSPKNALLWLGGTPLTDDLLREHYHRLIDFSPRLLRGYPSALALLAELVVREGLAPPPSIIATGSSSESLLPFHRDRIRAAFNVPHADLYGQAEHVASACSCPYEDGLHVDESYGYVEIVDDQGQVIEAASVVGEIVATGLGNGTAPLIRYRTGDRASWSGQTCRCGREGLLLRKIEGRKREQVIDKHGRAHLFGIAFYGPLIELSDLRAFQFVQPSAGVLEVDVVHAAGNDDVSDVRHALETLVDFDVQVRRVGQVRRTKVGKAPILWSAP